jgi:hypothetical protein
MPDYKLGWDEQRRGSVPGMRMGWDKSRQNIYLAPILYEGTITGLRIGAADGGDGSVFKALVDNLPTAVTDLVAANPGNLEIYIYDSANRFIKGVLKAAGTSETVATTGGPLNDGNLITDGTFDGAGWTAQSGWAVESGVATGTTTTNSIYRSTVPTAGGLYKSTWDLVSRTGGAAASRVFAINGTAQSVPGTYSYYRTYPTAGNANSGISGIDVFSGTVDNLLLKQVLTPSSSGATIVTAKGGTTYNFSYKNTSFTYNAASYYVIIRAIR